MVRYPVYSPPGVPTFWVRQSQLVPYGQENRSEARSPVTLKAGTIVTSDDGKEAPADATELSVPTIIESTDGGTASIAQAGGWTGKVALSDIVYPDPATFTYSGLD